MFLFRLVHQRYAWLIPFWWFLVGSTFAADYFVNSLGNDTSNCGTNNMNACATILFALNQAQNGDRIFFSGNLSGNGNTAINITRSLSILSIDNVPQNNVIDCNGTSRGFFIVNTTSALNITLVGFTVRGCILPTNTSLTLPRNTTNTRKALKINERWQRQCKNDEN
jgi:hypothetical protein